MVLGTTVVHLLGLYFLSRDWGLWAAQTLVPRLDSKAGHSCVVAGADNMDVGTSSLSCLTRMALDRERAGERALPFPKP